MSKETARVALAPPVVRALDDYLDGRTTGRIFIAQLGRLCRDAGLPAGVTPHSLRHSYATESLRLGAALQDVQDALGHADPRTTRRYDRSRHLREPDWTVAVTTDGRADPATAVADLTGILRHGPGGT